MKNVQKYLAAIYDFWLDIITVKTEIQVQRKCDRQGNIYWLVFDPVTGYSSCFSSESEVRIWIEQRYYSRRNLY